MNFIASLNGQCLVFDIRAKDKVLIMRPSGFDREYIVAGLLAGDIEPEMRRICEAAVEVYKKEIGSDK